MLEGVSEECQGDVSEVAEGVFEDNRMECLRCQRECLRSAGVSFEECKECPRCTRKSV